jgi:hypothetical protein
VAFAGRDRRPPMLATAALAAFATPLWWNLILRWTGGTGAFSHAVRTLCPPHVSARNRESRSSELSQSAARAAR